MKFTLPQKAALHGFAVGAMFLLMSGALANVPIWAIAIAVPGLLFVWPPLLLTSGVHGSAFGLLFLLIPFTNSFAYWLLARLWFRVRSKS
jgi:hypothetical protein